MTSKIRGLKAAHAEAKRRFMPMVAEAGLRVGVKLTRSRRARSAKRGSPCCEVWILVERRRTLDGKTDWRYDRCIAYGPTWDVAFAAAEGIIPAYVSALVLDAIEMKEPAVVQWRGLSELAKGMPQFDHTLRMSSESLAALRASMGLMGVAPPPQIVGPTLLKEIRKAISGGKP